MLHYITAGDIVRQQSGALAGVVGVGLDGACLLTVRAGRGWQPAVAGVNALTLVRRPVYGSGELGQDDRNSAKVTAVRREMRLTAV